MNNKLIKYSDEFWSPINQLRINLDNFKKESVVDIPFTFFFKKKTIKEQDFLTIDIQQLKIITMEMFEILNHSKWESLPHSY